MDREVRAEFLPTGEKIIVTVEHRDVIPDEGSKRYDDEEWFEANFEEPYFLIWGVFARDTSDAYGIRREITTTFEGGCLG